MRQAKEHWAQGVYASITHQKVSDYCNMYVRVEKSHDRPPIEIYETKLLEHEAVVRALETAAFYHIPLCLVLLDNRKLEDLEKYLQEHLCPATNSRNDQRKLRTHIRHLCIDAGILKEAVNVV